MYLISHMITYVTKVPDDSKLERLRWQLCLSSNSTLLFEFTKCHTLSRQCAQAETHITLRLSWNMVRNYIVIIIGASWVTVTQPKAETWACQRSYTTGPDRGHTLLRLRLAAALTQLLFWNSISGHITREPPMQTQPAVRVGFELATDCMQFYFFGN